MDLSNSKGYLREQLREGGIVEAVPDFPIPGVMFWDFLPLFSNTKVFHNTVAILHDAYRPLFKRADVLVAVDSRGFLMAPYLGWIGDAINCKPITLVRKKGKLPQADLHAQWKTEYGEGEMEMCSKRLPRNAHFLVVDDVVATGGTLNAVQQMISQIKGKVIGAACILDLPELRSPDDPWNDKIGSLFEVIKGEVKLSRKLWLHF